METVRTATPQLFANALMELCQMRQFNKVTVRSIADRAGIGIRSFYYYFEDKYDLVAWIFDQANEGVFNNYFLPTHDFRIFGRASIDALCENGVYNRNLMENTHGRYALRRIVQQQMYKRFSGHVHQELGHDPDPEIDFLLGYYMAFCTDALIDWFMGSRSIPIETLVRLTSDEMMPACLRPFLLP